MSGYRQGKSSEGILEGRITSGVDLGGRILNLEFFVESLEKQ